jgi:hypothetical protein
MLDVGAVRGPMPEDITDPGEDRHPWAIREGAGFEAEGL